MPWHYGISSSDHRGGLDLLVFLIVVLLPFFGGDETPILV